MLYIAGERAGKLLAEYQGLVEKISTQLLEEDDLDHFGLERVVLEVTGKTREALADLVRVDYGSPAPAVGWAAKE